MRWVAQEDGDGAGYDILSFNREGRERLVEVKTTCGTRTTPFLLTRNEHALSGERPDEFRILQVFEFAKAPRLLRLKPPLEDVCGWGFRRIGRRFRGGGRGLGAVRWHASSTASPARGEPRAFLAAMAKQLAITRHPSRDSSVRASAETPGPAAAGSLARPP